MLIVAAVWLSIPEAAEPLPTPPPVVPSEPASDISKRLLPGVTVSEGAVEFRGTVCADPWHPQTPVVYLELLVTGPDSREHESLVVTTVKPSAIHAGLLAAGLEAGHPVAWRGGKVDRTAAGPRVTVEVAVVGKEGVGGFVDLASWVVNQETRERLPSAPGWGLVFAGSLLDGRGYAADKTGTIIGLTGFGTEVVAASWDLSPEASIDEPVWIVDKERVPAFGAEVVVRIRAANSEKPAGKPAEKSDGDPDSKPNGDPEDFPVDKTPEKPANPT
jgi:hypothetical protein